MENMQDIENNKESIGVFIGIDYAKKERTTKQVAKEVRLKNMAKTPGQLERYEKKVTAKKERNNIKKIKGIK